MESISCMVLHDILERVLAKMCFDALLMCFSWFVAIPVTFNNLCCWTQRCGSLSRIQLRLTDQSWQTSPNESVLHLEVVFLGCWHQIEKLIQVIYITFLFVVTQITQFYCHKFEYWWHWNKSCKWKTYLQCNYMTFKRNCWESFFDDSFMCLFRFIAFRIAFNDLCCWTQRCGLTTTLRSTA